MFYANLCFSFKASLIASGIASNSTQKEDTNSENWCFNEISPLDYTKVKPEEEAPGVIDCKKNAHSIINLITKDF